MENSRVEFGLSLFHSLTLSLFGLEEYYYKLILVHIWKCKKITNTGKLNDSCERYNLIVAVEMNIVLLLVTWNHGRVRILT